MGLLQTLRNSLYGSFTFQGVGYPHGLAGSSAIVAGPDGTAAVPPEPGLASYGEHVYKSNGPIFALVSFRQLTFSTVEFKYQRTADRELLDTPTPTLLEKPWEGATSQNLLARCEVDASLAGNSYWTKEGGELLWLRPDWVDVILTRRPNGTWRKAGIKYFEDGRRDHAPTLSLPMSEVVHYMPLQDPLAPWRGMSWITPVIRETMVDWAATTHQQKFFEQGTGRRLAAVLPESMTPEQFSEFKTMMDAGHAGADNAYKTAYIGGGADLTVIGTDLQELDLRNVQGGLETRLAAAAGVPVTLVGFREGNQGSSLNASTYAQSRRRYTDGTLDALWREVCGSFSKVTRPPRGARLWFDGRHVPLLREDAKDAAEIMREQIGAVRVGVEAGFDPEAVVSAVNNDDMKRLAGAHTGLVSVQLQPPGSKIDTEAKSVTPASIGELRRLLDLGWRIVTSEDEDPAGGGVS